MYQTDGYKCYSHGCVYVHRPTSLPTRLIYTSVAIQFIVRSIVVMVSFRDFILVHFYRPHPKDDGRLYFQSVHTCGGEGGTWSQVWGVPSHRSWGGGTPSQVQGVVPHPRSGGYPIQTWSGGARSTPQNQVWMGYPPGPGMGYPLPPGPGMGYSPRSWTGYPPTRSGLDRAAQ